MKLIETKTLSSNAASIELTSIPQTMTDLLILVSARSSDTSDPRGYYYSIAFNGGSSYAARYLQGQGVGVGNGTLPGLAGVSSTAGGTANTFSNDSIYVPNYTSTTAKTYSVDSVSEQNAAGAYQTIVAGSFSSSTGVTTITLTLPVGQFVVGSTVSLYGILKGTGGATVS